MAAPSPPPKPEFDDCDETSIQCKWEADPDCSYRLEYKEFPDDWAQAMKIDIAKGKGSAETNSVEGLNPTSTYTLRLIAIKDGVESEPGEVLTVDTQGGFIIEANTRLCAILSYISCYRSIARYCC